tara:strand:+ start:1867 stop:2574 length:708 start_codon:yes stop_codon:yes gene_type:complete
MRITDLSKKEWESDFFNRDIYNLTLEGKSPIKQQPPFPKGLICSKVAASDHGAVHQLYQMGFTLSAGELVLSRSLENVASDYTLEIVEASQDDIEELKSIVANIYLNHSRFRHPFFSQAECSCFYEEWIKNAVYGSFDDKCFVKKCGGRIAGFVSIASSGGEWAIGLIGVAEQFRGEGIGSSLIQFVLNYAKRYSANSVCVATQLSNIDAIRLYEKHGFLTKNINYWLYRDENSI